MTIRYPEKTAAFIERARKKHGDKYDYSKTDFISCRKKVIITCHVHGDFEQVPIYHQSKNGCPKCAIDSMKKSKFHGIERFIEKARKVHGTKYDYSRSKYIGALKKLTVTCPEHGDFSVQASNHLEGLGCAKCSYDAQRERYRREFFEKAKRVHGNRYDYSKTEFVNRSTLATITCPVHGNFQMRPGNHLMGQGCPKCGITKNTERMTGNTKDFICKAKEVHGPWYDYGKVKYTKALEPVTITCPLHGDFEQTASRHLSGHNCPRCETDPDSGIRRYVYILELGKINGLTVYKIGKAIAPKVRQRTLTKRLKLDNGVEDVKQVWLYTTTSKQTQTTVENMLLESINYPKLQKHELPDGYFESRITNLTNSEICGFADKLVENIKKTIAGFKIGQAS